MIGSSFITGSGLLGNCGFCTIGSSCGVNEPKNRLARLDETVDGVSCVTCCCFKLSLFNREFPNKSC